MTSKINLLITGATGFVGRELVRSLLLTKKFNIQITKRSDKIYFNENVVEFNFGNLENFVDKKNILNNIDIIIHLAGRAHQVGNKKKDYFEKYQKANQYSISNLANLASKSGVKKFIFLSTLKVNGENNSIKYPFVESNQANPHDYYSKSKYEGELSLINSCANSNMKYVIVRAPLIYGPALKGNLKILEILLKKNIPMPFGLINNRRSLLFIENLINFIRICIESDSSDNHTFLISDDQDLSIFELIKIMKNILKSKSIIIPIPKIILKILFYLLNKKSLNNKLLESLTLDCAKAKKILSWKPDSDIKNNLRKTFNQ